MSHPASAGAGRDESRLRFLESARENLNWAKGSITDPAEDRLIDAIEDVINYLLAVPDPLASDTEPRLQTPTCGDHGPMRLVSAFHICDTCSTVDEVADMAPLASSSAPQGKTSLLGSLNVAIWGVNSHTYAPGVVDRVLAWLTEHGR